MPREAYSTPLEVTLVDDEVVITGPEGAALSLTKQAAIVSAKRLLQAVGGEEPAEIYQKPLG